MGVYDNVHQYKIMQQLDVIQSELANIKVDLELIINASAEYQCEVCRGWFALKSGENKLPIHPIGISATGCEGSGSSGIGKRIRQ